MASYSMSTTTLSAKTGRSGGGASSTLAYDQSTKKIRMGKSTRTTGDSVTSGTLHRAIIIDFSSNSTYQEVLSLVNSGATITSIQMAFVSATSNSYTYNLTVGAKASSTATTVSTISSTQKVDLGTIAKKTTMNASKKYTITTCGIPSHGLYCAGCGASSNSGYHDVTQVYLYVDLTLPSTTLTTSVSPSGYGTVTAGGTMTLGDTKSLTATPASDTTSYSYAFSSWTKSGGGSLSSTTSNPTTFTAGSTNATVTANFTRTPKSYTLTTQVNTSGYGTVTAGGSVAYGNTKSLTATPTAQTSEYTYTFSNWSISGSGSLSSTTANPTTFTGGAGVSTVTANFVRTPRSYTLTTSVSPTGYGTVTSGASVAYGSTKSLTATPADQTDTYTYSFSNWTKSGGGSLSSTTANPTTYTGGISAATVIANFTRSTRTYTLTTQVNTSGYGTVTTGGSIAVGGTKSLTATPSEQSDMYTYSFSGWTITGGGSLSSTTSATTTFTGGTSASTVTANFTRTNRSYTLTTQASPSSGGTVTAGGSIAYGSTKSLTATPASGYAFSNWTISGGGSLSTTTSATTTFTGGTSSSTVTAVFVMTYCQTIRYVNSSSQLVAGTLYYCDGTTLLPAYVCYSNGTSLVNGG